MHLILHAPRNSGRPAGIQRRGRVKPSRKAARSRQHSAMRALAIRICDLNPERIAALSALFAAWRS